MRACIGVSESDSSVLQYGGNSEESVGLDLPFEDVTDETVAHKLQSQGKQIFSVDRG
jgi:hypothetical protein